MTSPRTVAVFTSTRADAGPLSPVIQALDASPDHRLVVIATGTHLDPRRGNTLADITVGPDSALEIVDPGISGDEPGALVRAAGVVAAETEVVLGRHGVDAMLVLGDRWELLAAVSAALLRQVPVGHLHGGEVTEGALDERVRHAVTKLADLHFCATETYARRLRQLGEEPWRIHVTGAPSLDRLLRFPSEGAERLVRDAVGGALRRPWGLVTYHPPTVERAGVGQRAREVLEAAAERLASVVITAPGLDPGAEEVMEEIDRATATYDHLRYVPNLGPAYPAALATADVMVGNSSSGVIEAASFELPVVDVGNRQAGRVRPANVIHSGEERTDVLRAIEQALSPEFRSSLQGLVNPYGDGHASERVLRILSEIRLEELACKRFVDVGAQA